MSQQILLKFEKGDAELPKLHYAIRAKAKQDVRYYLNYLYVDKDNRLIGCDGHRLHISHGSSLSAGYYEVIKNTKTMVWIATAPDLIKREFPDVEKAIVSKKPKAKKHWIKTDPRYTDVAAYHVLSHFGICANLRYINDALCQDFGDVLIGATDKAEPIFFDYQADDVLGVVMPMRANEAQSLEGEQ